MNTNLGELRSYLHKKFEARSKLNPLYSKRAYSRDLGIGATSLNDFVSGKRSLSFENINKIFKYLGKKTTVNCSWCGKRANKQPKMLRLEFSIVDLKLRCNLDHALFLSGKVGAKNLFSGVEVAPDVCSASDVRKPPRELKKEKI